MGRRTRPRNRGGDSYENLRGKLREYEKNIRKLRKYIKYLENQLGIGVEYHDIDVVEEPTKEVEQKDSKDSCERCKSSSLNYLKIKKLDVPYILKICTDCGKRVLIEDG